MTRHGDGSGFRDFVQELRRRKVFRVAALYLAAGFGVLEAADILQDAMQLPSGLLSSVTVLLIMGFPLALVVGWKFDVTEEGLRRTDVVRSGQPRGWPLATLLAVSALSVGAAGWTVDSMTVPVDGARPLADTVPDPGEYASIAVLPFTNLSGDSANDYFGDGLAEELGNVLSRIEGLRVAARTSAFALRGREIDAREIGDTLGVGMLLEGSVRRAGERVRVSAQLIRAQDGLSLWSDSWDRELSTANVFAIQDEITRSIANELEGELALETEGLDERRTENLEAYDLYLLGRHEWAERTPDGLRKAIDLFEGAIARDPTYALAWAGLADAWEARPFFDASVSMATAEPLARSAALRALDISPNLAEAHAALGVILSDYDYDSVKAIRHLRRAIELNPNHAQAWSWLCVAHTMAGDPSAGLDACDRAITLDPLYPIPHAQRSLALMALDRYEEALSALRHADGLGPLSWVLAVAMRLELGRTGEIDSDLVRTGAALGLDEPERMRTVARAIRARSEAPRRNALRVVRDLEAAGQIRFLELAPLYAWIGARDEALRVFEEGVAERDPWLPFAAHVTSFDDLRSAKRFTRALDSLGISPGS